MRQTKRRGAPHGETRFDLRPPPTTMTLGAIVMGYLKNNDGEKGREERRRGFQELAREKGERFQGVEECASGSYLRRWAAPAEPDLAIGIAGSLIREPRSRAGVESRGVRLLNPLCCARIWRRRALPQEMVLEGGLSHQRRCLYLCTSAHALPCFSRQSFTERPEVCVFFEVLLAADSNAASTIRRGKVGLRGFGAALGRGLPRLLKRHAPDNLKTGLQECGVHVAAKGSRTGQRRDQTTGLS